MPVKNFIFLSSEGYTFQPESKSVVPDVENLQVIGFSSGSNSEEAFNKLVMESTSLVESSFKEIFSYELSTDYKANKKFHHLK